MANKLSKKLLERSTSIDNSITSLANLLYNEGLLPSRSFSQFQSELIEELSAEGQQSVQSYRDWCRDRVETRETFYCLLAAMSDRELEEYLAAF